MQRTGVFGSAFNPPTQGHFDVLTQAAPHFDRILLVPSVAHAFNKETIALEKRAELLEAFCIDIGNIPCQFEVSLLERELLANTPDTPVYTWAVLDALSVQQPNTTFSFIRGPDNADPKVWQRFYRHQDIERRWSIFTAQETVAVRSSKVRNALASLRPGMAPDRDQMHDQLQEWLTPSVMALILDQHLYHCPN